MDGCLLATKANMKKLSGFGGASSRYLRVFRFGNSQICQHSRHGRIQDGRLVDFNRSLTFLIRTEVLLRIHCRVDFGVHLRAEALRCSHQLSHDDASVNPQTDPRWTTGSFDRSFTFLIRTEVLLRIHCRVDIGYHPRAEALRCSRQLAQDDASLKSKEW